MQVKRQNLSLIVEDNAMRIYVARPAQEGTFPGIVFYSDIYQLGSPITRLADHLAGYGFVVAAPEIYYRQLPLGTIIEPTDLGRIQGNEAARKTSVNEFDSDTHAVIKFLSSYEAVSSQQIGTMGFCIGGHLACRAAFDPLVKASVYIYPTGIHNGKLGRERADTLERMRELQGKVLLVFGTLDPHVPEDGRVAIRQALEAQNIRHKILEYKANHTFMRDDGYRFDPVATDTVWREIIIFFQSIL